MYQIHRMRNKLFFLILFSFVIAKSQTYPPINIWGVDKDTVEQGDTLTLYFKYDLPTQTPYTTAKLTIFPNFGNGNSDLIWQDSLQNLALYPKDNNGVYSVKLLIKDTYQSGVARIYASNPVTQYIEIFIKQKLTTFIKTDRNDVSIIETFYVNLYGQIIEPINSTPIIKVDKYSDGTIIYKQIVIK